GPPYCGLFHRLPGGSFVFDASATAALGVGLLHPIVNDGTSSLRLKVTDGGTLYGMLVSPEQQAASAMVPAPGGKQVAVDTHLDYGVLVDGTWTKHVATIPATYVAADKDTISLQIGDVDAPAQGYAAFLVAPRTNGAAPEPLLLSRFDDNGNID